MAGERLTLWTSVSAAAATVVVVAVSAVVIWHTAGKQRDQFIAELTALNGKVEATNAKIEKANETVAEIKKITALENTTKAIGQLNSEIKKTNEGLAELQKVSSLDGIKITLAQLDSKIEKAGTALAEIKKMAPMDSIRAELKGIETALASLAAKVATTDKTLAEIKSASPHSSDTSPAGDAARDQAIAKLSNAIDDLKTGMAGNASSQNKSLEAIAKSIDSLKAPAMAQKGGMNLAGLHASEPPAAETTSSIPATQPLTVRFDPDARAQVDAQTNAIIGHLKTIMKDRHDCSISVAGYTDTLGSDDVNLDVSKERADMIAAKLKAAFAGQKISIDSVGWGERRLKVWTPDGTSKMANRRVEVGVACKG